MLARLLALLLLAAPAPANSRAQSLAEDAVCRTAVDDKNGTCVSLYKCRSAAIYHLYSNAGLTRAVRALPTPELCAAEGDGVEEPRVCCTDCQLDQAETLKQKVVMEYGIKYSKRGSTAWRKCLEYFRDLPYPCHGVSGDVFSISRNERRQCDYLQQHSFGIGGYAAKEGEFPHMALLGYGGTRESAQWLCGGAVISERYVLTAAHCTSTPLLGNVTFVALGVLTRDEVDDYWKVYSIRRIVVHPEYHSPQKYHDIALLETNTEINFGKNLLPACLDVGKASTDRGTAPGWGRLGHKHALADHLMVMELDKYDNATCAAMFPKHRLFKRGFDSSTQLCYGRRDKVVDTCETTQTMSR